MENEQRGKGKHYDPVPTEGLIGIDFPHTSEFDARETLARAHTYSFEADFWRVVDLARGLLRTRNRQHYSDHSKDCCGKWSLKGYLRWQRLRVKQVEWEVQGKGDPLLHRSPSSLRPSSEGTSHSPLTSARIPG